MPAYYRANLEDFTRATLSEIEAILADQNAKQTFPLQPAALFAWQEQLPRLQHAAKLLLQEEPASNSWSILLEYPIPRVGKRIDAVILAHDVILVIEMKTGATLTSAAKQADDYALNLACFHDQSASRATVPIVVSSSGTSRHERRTTLDDLIKACVSSQFPELGSVILEEFRKHTSNSLPIDPVAWDEALFKPIPPIIDAAVALYSNMNVFEIGHSCAAREDLDRTTSALITAVHESRISRRKTICFVTGVPGAGKTLVGLNAVHEGEIRDVGSFLSGNGPLVKVIREALIRDVAKRQGTSRADAVLKVQTFIQNVHRFSDGFHKNEKAPHEHVIIFDEAQRAWDLAESQRSGRELAEPEMMLDIMNRHDDWAVIIALVGGGQEINRGEAGLAEWGAALEKFPGWNVIASPKVLEANTEESDFTLFKTGASFPQRVQSDPSLHLQVAVRSIHAQRISDWVNALLNGKSERAFHISSDLRQPPRLTRSLASARMWLNERRRGLTRSGLLGSASANRLRADGLEPSFDFHRRFDWENWFLDDDNDVRCSSRLEVFATQFEVQGLELDWVGVCWGEDFVWDGAKWVSNQFNNKRWKSRKMKTDSDAQKHRFRRNAYRVLLTRARQGMILYVPQPEDTPDRLRQQLDETAQYLLRCGASELN